MSLKCHGSCICGAIKFEASIDFTPGTGRCNCSNCWKIRLWFVRVKPEDFKLLSGEDAITDYVFKSDWHHQQFCKICGVHTFHKLNRPDLFGEIVSVNVACLDNLDVDELMGLKINYLDGRNDNYRNEPKEKQIM